MSRKLLRTGLAACALAALLAAPAHAAGGGRAVTDGIWQWVLGMWEDIHMTIDPNGSTTGAQNDTRLTIDPNGDEANASGGGGEGDIGMHIDPDGDEANASGREGDIRWTIDPNG